MKAPTRRRLLEILPGFLAWSALLLPIVLSQFIPAIVVGFIILFDLYWVYKAVITAVQLIISYRRYKAARKIKWLNKAKAFKRFPELYQAVIVATYKEELPILEATFQSIADSDYPKENIIVVLATEGRDHERAMANAKALKHQFGHLLSHFFVTVHPDGIAGEVKGKGANITWAGRQLQKELDRMQIEYDKVIVTTLDADNRPDRQYFAELSYRFLSHPDPIHVSFQPIPMFFNNLWKAPVTSRLLAHHAMFWVMIESTRPDRLRNFSSHSQSMKALVHTDFWSTQTIVEDGHQYWRSYFAYNGNYSVVPLYVPIYQDAVVGRNLYESMRELYLQQRRWSWGVSDVPYIIENCFKNTSIPWYIKAIKTFQAMEAYFSWATYSIYILITGWIPIILNETFSDTVLAYNFPLVASRLLTVAMIGLLTNLIIGSLLVVATDERHRHLHQIAIEWLLTPFISPVISIVFGAFPALDSQTRLMFGRYLEFNVTAKRPVAELAPGQSPS